MTKKRKSPQLDMNALSPNEAAGIFNVTGVQTQDASTKDSDHDDEEKPQQSEEVKR